MDESFESVQLWHCHQWSRGSWDVHRVGDWKICASQIGSFPPGFGVKNMKNIWNVPPSHVLSFWEFCCLEPLRCDGDIIKPLAKPQIDQISEFPVFEFGHRHGREDGSRWKIFGTSDLKKRWFLLVPKNWCPDQTSWDWVFFIHSCKMQMLGW